MTEGNLSGISCCKTWRRLGEDLATPSMMKHSAKASDTAGMFHGLTTVAHFAGFQLFLVFGLSQFPSAILHEAEYS